MKRQVAGFRWKRRLNVNVKEPLEREIKVIGKMGYNQHLRESWRDGNTDD